MNYIIEKKSDYTLIITNQEKLTALIAPELKAVFNQLTEEEAQVVMLDLGRVKYIDSSGLTALLLGTRRCENLILVSPKGMVLKMLEISQLDNILNIADSVEDAMSCVG